MLDIAAAGNVERVLVGRDDHELPVATTVDWAGTSERMILDTYRHKLEEISEQGPIDED